MVQEVKRSRVQKRRHAKLASLDQPLSDDNDSTLYDLLSDTNDQTSLLKHETLREIARQALKSKNKEAKRAVIWLLVDILNVEPERITKKLNYLTFVRFGLQHYLWIFFNNSPFRAINFAYPGKFLPYQMARKPNGYWKKEQGKDRAIEALRHVLKKTNYDQALYPKIISQKFLREVGLLAACSRFFKTQFEYLSATFPGVFSPWKMNVTPDFFFDSKENVKTAVHWLVQKILGYALNKLTPEEIWENKISAIITKDTFSKYGLREIIAIYKSPEPVLRMVYPEKFLPWDFPNKKKWAGEKGRKLAAQATRWLIEEKAKTSPFSPQITCEFFRQNRLWGMLTDKKLGFNTSPRAALENAYPDSDFSFRFTRNKKCACR